MDQHSNQAGSSKQSLSKLDLENGKLTSFHEESVASIGTCTLKHLKIEIDPHSKQAGSSKQSPNKLKLIPTGAIECFQKEKHPSYPQKSRALKTTKNTIRKKVVENPKEEDDVDYLLHISHTQVIWAWIFGVSTYRADPVDQDFKVSYASTLSDFDTKMTKEINEIMKQNFHQANHIRSKDIYQNILQLSNILWFINIRFLKNLAVLQNINFDYSKENCLIYQWILDIFEHKRNHSKKNSSKNEGLNCSDERVMSHVVSTLTSVLISGKKDNLVYVFDKTIESNNPKYQLKISIGVISEIQLLMTKAAVTVLASFYKTISPTKWKILFVNQSAFLHHLAKLQSSFAFLSNSSEGIPVGSIHSIKALPWAAYFNEYDKIVFGKLNQNLSWEHLQGSFQKYFKQISSSENQLYHGRLSELLNQQLSSEYMNEKRENQEDIWKCICRIKSMYESKKGKFNQFHVYYSNSQINRQSKMSVNVKDFKIIHSLSGSPSEEKFLQELKYFSEILWVLNSTLIEALGHTEEQDSQTFQQEQNNIQKELSSIINMSTNGLGESLDPETKNTAVKLQDLILSSLYNNSELSFKLKQEAHTKAAVMLMAYYYCKANKVKWATIFQNESNFIHSLFTIGMRMRKTYSYNYHREEVIPKLKSAQLIPWKNPFSLSPIQQKSITWLFQKSKNINI
ncbi:hypothetical protein PGT21_021996 [Puccinia graminis f. sp. tritici]|uniref:Uncharacterized protein n=2 Tax=Puccinia graminis f. sp. tritici TaxID=56615 RepID=A0A5B0PB77_PUCGR|nr:hypothetical protein PGT21_021996 [Puccinia graminis f. sp. tritici]